MRFGQSFVNSLHPCHTVGKVLIPLIGWIQEAGANPCGVAIALDRQERGKGKESAAQEVENQLGIPVIAIAGLNDLIEYLESRSVANIDITAIRRYRNEYGI